MIIMAYAFYHNIRTVHESTTLLQKNTSYNLYNINDSQNYINNTEQIQRYITN